jgi:hypothetical protein
LAASPGGTAAVPAAHGHGKHRHGKHARQLRLAASGGNGGSASQEGTGLTKPHAPITSRYPNVAYTGPVYELSAADQLVPYVAPSAQQAQDSGTGGSVATSGAAKPKLLVPGKLARLVDGLAAAPMEAPEAVKEIIWAGDEIVGLPYIYGGGHASWQSPGYDCSGTVSYALHGADMLPAPEDSSELETFSAHGIGEWVTVFANPGHAYMDVAGLRLDTSSADDPSNQQGPRWRPLRQRNAGYTIRHPLGF